MSRNFAYSALSVPARIHWSNATLFALVVAIGCSIALFCSSSTAEAAPQVVWSNDFEWDFDPAGHANPVSPKAIRLLDVRDSGGAVKLGTVDFASTLAGWDVQRYSGPFNSLRLPGEVVQFTTARSKGQSSMAPADDRFTSIHNEMTFFGNGAIRSATDFARINLAGGANDTDHALVIGRGGYRTGIGIPALEPNAEANAKISNINVSQAKGGSGLLHVQFDLAVPLSYTETLAGLSVQAGKNYVDNQLGSENGVKSAFRLAVNPLPPNRPDVNPFDKTAYALHWFDRKIDGSTQNVPLRWDDGTMMANGAQTSPIFEGDKWSTIHILMNSSGAAAAYVDPFSGAAGMLKDNGYSVWIGQPGNEHHFLDNVDAQTDDIDLDGLNFFLADGNNDLTNYLIDNIFISDGFPDAKLPPTVKQPVVFPAQFIQTIPEPGALALTIPLGCLGVIRRATRKRATPPPG